MLSRSYIKDVPYILSLYNVTCSAFCARDTPTLHQHRGDATRLGLPCAAPRVNTMVTLHAFHV